jgi:hypothetical protein
MRVEVEVTVEDLVDGLLRGNLLRDKKYIRGSEMRKGGYLHLRYLHAW